MNKVPERLFNHEKWLKFLSLFANSDEAMRFLDGRWPSVLDLSNDLPKEEMHRRQLRREFLNDFKAGITTQNLSAIGFHQSLLEYKQIPSDMGENLSFSFSNNQIYNSKHKFTEVYIIEKDVTEECVNWILSTCQKYGHEPKRTTLLKEAKAYFGNRLKVVQ